MTRLLTILIIIVSSLSTGAANGKTGAGLWKSLGEESEAFDSMMERAAFLDMPRRDLMSIIRSFPAQPHASDARQAAARLAYWKSWVLFKEDPDSAVKLSAFALERCDSAAYPYDHTRFSIMRADFLRIHGRLADAYFIYRDKLNRLREAGDRFWEARTMVAVGAIMQELGEFHESMHYYMEAQNIFDEIDSHACNVKNRINVANIHYMLGQQQTAMKWLENLETNRFVRSDSVYMANVLVSRFHISEYADRHSALKAYEISRRLDNDHLSVLTLLSMGMLSFREKEYAKANAYLKEGLGLTYAINDSYNRRRILEGLLQCSSSAGDTAAANSYRRFLLELNDSLYNHERIDRMRKTEHLATINRYEEEARKTEEKNRWQLILTLSIGGAVVIVLVLSLCLLWMSRRKTESDRKLEEEKNRRLELLNRQYSMEIEAKEKELTSTTVLMSQKNAQLKALSDQIERMKQKGDIAAENGDSLKTAISHQLSADDDWRYFKLRFEKVHPDFFTRLKEACTALSKTDLRLCAYIRVGMSAKEIAQVLSVKPETINTSRYRIRKKMEIPADMTLESRLEQFP